MQHSNLNDAEVWRERLHEKELQLERAENRHNSQTVRFVDEISRLREEKFKVEEAIALKESKLEEATTIISDLRRHMIQQEVTRDAMEAQEEIRRRAKCDRTVQCDIGSATPVSQMSLNASPNRDTRSPFVSRTRPASAFLNLALQERERYAKNTVTTALTQTDPVIVMEISEEHEGLSPHIPTLAIGNRSMSPGAVFALTNKSPIVASHPSSVMSTARETEPLTARDLQHFSINVGTPRNSMLTSRQLTNRVTLSDTPRAPSASPEAGHGQVSESQQHYASVSRSPGNVLLSHCHEELREDARIEDSEVLETVEEWIVVPSGSMMDASQQTTKLTFVSTACNTDPLMSVMRATNKCEIGEELPSAVTQMKGKALSHADVVADRVGALFVAIKGELDHDGHFAALIVTGMLASFMFAR